MKYGTSIVSLALVALTTSSPTSAFQSSPTYAFTAPSAIKRQQMKHDRNIRLHADTATSPSPEVTNTSGKGFGTITTKKTTLKNSEKDSKSNNINENETELETQEIMKMSSPKVKEQLLNLLPSMTGTAEEFRLVEAYVNALEEKFVPPQTLDFLNLAIHGDWQFLFTTNQLGRPSPKLRLTELVQNIDINGFDGKLSNRASWDLAQDGITFDARGSFASTISYNINQGARMTINEDHDLKIELAPGSAVPEDTQELVGLIHRAMPTEMFDSSQLGMDTTYVDTEIRIVRYTGVRHEGVRNIFMRKGAVQINPTLVEK